MTADTMAPRVDCREKGGPLVRFVLEHHLAHAPELA
jgi:hypothetical protein